jgi:hypothetical protein
VLKRRTLPWERKVDANEHVPWLALVVIAEGEGSLSAETPVDQCVTSGVSLPEPDDRDVATSVYLSVTDTVVKGVFPTKDDLELLAHVREVDLSDSELMSGDDDGFLAVIIANRLPQPAYDDDLNRLPKKYLACLINVEGQTDVLPPPVPDNVVFQFEFDAMAVVQDMRVVADAVVNDPDRFAMGAGAAAQQLSLAGPLHAARAAAAPLAAAPASAAAVPNTTSTAFLAGKAWADGPAAIDAAAVSIAADDAPAMVREAMAGGWKIPIEYYALEPTYRFPVLAHWSFTVSGDATFEQLMQHIDVGLLGTLDGDEPPLTPAEQARAAKQAGPPPSARPEPELAETGHVGLDHQTRRGDRVRAWYRGPLSPHPTTREQPDPDSGRLPLAHTSDQLRLVVPDGREDVSLAAAFEIGRLLALSQPAIVNALLRWRQEQFGAQRAAHLAAVAALPIGFLASSLFDHRDPGLGALVGREVLMSAADRSEAVFAPARPLVDAGRPLDYARGNLDETIAAGLGLSLDEIRRQAEQVGIVGALADTAVRVADQQGGGLDDPSFGALRVGLDQHVDAVARDTLKRRVPPTDAAPGGTRRRARRPAADALDDLLAAIDRSADR